MLILFRLIFQCLKKAIVEIKESRKSWERYKQNYKGEDEGSCYGNPELTRNPNTTKHFLTACHNKN